jgi:hypothetical protein
VLEDRRFAHYALAPLAQSFPPAIEQGRAVAVTSSEYHTGP